MYIKGQGSYLKYLLLFYYLPDVFQNFHFFGFIILSAFTQIKLRQRWDCPLKLHIVMGYSRSPLSPFPKQYLHALYIC